MMHTNNFHTVSAEDMRQMIDEAAASIRAKTNKQFRTFIVLGSGLGGLGDLVENAVKISYGDIPHFAQSTVAGHKGQLIIGDLFGKPVMLMQGRFHFYEGHPLWQIAVPVRVARALGAENFIVTNAAGGINRTFKVADVMLITDQINLIGMAGNNPLIGPNDESIGPRFPAMTQTYDKDFQELALKVAKESGVELKQGVYVGLAGPCFESPAELRFLRAIGADSVGMSTTNEVAVARHCGMRVLGFSGITNVAVLSADEGVPPTHEEVMEAAPKLAPKLTALVRGVLQEM